MFIPLKYRTAAMLAVLVAAFVLVGWIALRPPAFDRTKIYRIGYGNDAPMHFVGPDGQPTGLAVNLVQEAARRTGITLEWKQGSGFNQRDMDMWVLQTVRPERLKQLHLTEPYLQAESCFLVLADSPIRVVGDLKNARISYGNAAILRDTLKVLLPAAEILPSGNSAGAI